jgi:predicted phage-related endonuclease
MEAVKKNEFKQITLAEFRATGIREIEAPILHGFNGPYPTAPARAKGRLWDEKVGCYPNDPDHQLDLMTTAAREVASLKLFGATDRLKHQLAANKMMSFLIAEIDGFDRETKTFVRIVTQDEARHSAVERADLPLVGGRVPRPNWIEIQHVFAVTGFKNGYFASTANGTDVTVVKVEPDLAFISNHVAECIQFWDYVRRCELPPGAINPLDEEAVLSWVTDLQEAATVAFTNRVTTDEDVDQFVRERAEKSHYTVEKTGVCEYKFSPKTIPALVVGPFTI